MHTCALTALSFAPRKRFSEQDARLFPNSATVLISLASYSNLRELMRSHICPVSFQENTQPNWKYCYHRERSLGSIRVASFVFKRTSCRLHGVQQQQEHICINITVARQTTFLRLQKFRVHLSNLNYKFTKA